ncbi:MAG: AAA family ATPase [Thermanaerothrix sp.]|jgi:AAA+ superfamily predicted ATPase|uniref:AAA family ATPase n=1 Tax=Thermanaerothrix sp. TaxID=2972675 RepID=UPI003C7CFB56
MPRLFQQFEEQLDIYLRARFTLLVLVTPEEERALQKIRAVCERTQRHCLAWDLADGFQWVVGSGALPVARDPLTALEQIDHAEAAVSTLYILKDFHEAWGNPQIKRKLRNLAQRLKFTKKSILITTVTSHIPNELRDEAVLVDFALPSAEELEEVLNRLTATPGVRVNLTPLGREKLVQAAIGLTASQAQRVFAKAIVEDGALDDRDIDLVTEEKKQIIRESEALEFYPVTETPDDVGGLGVLKEWLRLREKAFTQEARQYGLPAPKGIGLIGIPGTGKSLTAKMIGGLWRLPLIRLDVGALFGSLVGESEERTRRALRLAETIAPCIIWIDEIEKALAHGGLDSGTSTRVFATILTWMQEKTAPCFVVATANDISALPPELLRRGRFDEIFFLDLPTFSERREIFAVHLRKRNRVPDDYDLDRLAAASEGYVGAEIEQAIIDAMYIGFNDGQREFTTEDILLALSKQVPLSRSQRETIEMLRNWLREGRAQSASFREVTEAENQFVPIQLDVKRR